MTCPGESPILPLHPLRARITTRITSTPELSAAEQLERVWCDVWTTSEKRKVSFSKRDGLVHFDGPGGFRLDGMEVESYECHP